MKNVYTIICTGIFCTSYPIDTCDLASNHVIDIVALSLSSHHDLRTITSEVGSGDGEALYVNTL